LNALGGGALALLLATAGQLLLGRYLPSLGRSVDLFTVLVVYYAVSRRRAGVMMVGAGAGLVQDLFTHTLLGMNAFKKTLVGYLLGALGSMFVLSQPLPRFGVLCLATLLEALIEAGLYLVLGQHAGFPSPGELIRLGIGNGIIGTILYWIVSRMGVPR
jgi:rod shape-determining protein MreD